LQGIKRDRCNIIFLAGGNNNLWKLRLITKVVRGVAYAEEPACMMLLR